MFGVDYSYARPAIATLKAHDVKFVCRYVSTPGNAKNLTKAEADELQKAGIVIVVVFETDAMRAVGGQSSGEIDAKSAEAQVIACGLPKDCPIYFTVDFDVMNTQVNYVKDYFRGINSVHGVTRTGVYGGYTICKILSDYGLVGYVWQTYAWSHGTWLPKSNIRQEKNGVKWPEGEVDYDSAYTVDFGQYPLSNEVTMAFGMENGNFLGEIPVRAGGPAISFGVPDSAKHVTFRAGDNETGSIPPKLLVVVAPSMQRHTLEPVFGKSAWIDCTGAHEISVRRLDWGESPVTVDFQS